MYHHVSIIDDFYDDPFAVRKTALALDYSRKAGATYPGLEAVCKTLDWRGPWETLRTYIQEDVDPVGTKDPAFPQGKFRIAMKSDEAARVDGVHIDEQPWSGVIYLSRDEDCHRQPAVCFYKHRETDLTFGGEEWWAYITLKLEFAYIDSEERKDRFWNYMRTPSHWIEVDRVQNRFNRAILLHSKQFHASAGIFGNAVTNARLTQHFEFY